MVGEAVLHDAADDDDDDDDDFDDSMIVIMVMLMMMVMTVVMMVVMLVMMLVTMFNFWPRHDCHSSDPRTNANSTPQNQLPSTTLPKTTCLPSRWGVSTMQMKNWLPFLITSWFCFSVCVCAGYIGALAMVVGL